MASLDQLKGVKDKVAKAVPRDLRHHWKVNQDQGFQ
jgi:hypothetical protein